MGRKTTLITYCAIALLTAGLLSCKKKSGEVIDGPDPVAQLQAEPGEELSAGEGTVKNASIEAFGFQGSNFSAERNRSFSMGNSLFRDVWVTAPSSTFKRDGLGPLVNANSCATCHFKDGRGRPPVEGETSLLSMLVRLSIVGQDEHGGPKPEPNYGGQLQDKAILGVLPEAKVNISYEEVPGIYADGSTYSLRKPTYTFTDLNYGPMDPNMLYSPRVAPQMPGLGLLEAMDERTIQLLADPLDLNADGISGRTNRVWDAMKNTYAMGRFGWKANQPSLSQQTAGAFHGDMGITSSIFPDEALDGNQLNLYGSLPTGGKPEIADSNLEDVIFYCQTLTVPERRNWTDQEVLQGKLLFSKLECHKCHVPKMVTSSTAEIPELRDQTIRPYTDLLLHDMGEALTDGRPDFEAQGNEWRTPPLWGIGLVKVVNKHTFFLHDGRARNLEEAILWHGGEAQKSKEGFLKLPQSDRAKLIKFLESL